MTTIRARRALGAEPLGLPICLSRSVHPIGLVGPGATRWSLHELPVAVSLDPGRRLPRVVAPYREEPCPPMPVNAHLGTSCCWQLSSPRPCWHTPSTSLTACWPRCPGRQGALTRWLRLCAGRPSAPDRRDDGLRTPAPRHLMASLPATGLPRYRAIVALDIERSSSRLDPIKGELRNKTYELFEVALCTAGIDKRHRDRFVDRGDGILALIHPVDQVPKALLLNRVVPLLNRLLAEYNAGLTRHSQPQRQLRIRVVMHAGEVHYDANGCFGEDLDVAFRLLDAARVKRALRETADPLVLVVSGDIYSSVVRHGYDGIDHQTFHPLVRVQIAGKRYPGWIHIPRHATLHTVTQMASYRRPA